MFPHTWMKGGKGVGGVCALTKGGAIRFSVRDHW